MDFLFLSKTNKSKLFRFRMTYIFISRPRSAAHWQSGGFEWL